MARAEPAAAARLHRKQQRQEGAANGSRKTGSVVPIHAKACQMSTPYRFCPQCAQALRPKYEPDAQGQASPRMACPDSACGFVHWDNPTPVVAAIVEHGSKIILARNRAWSAPFFALITGFLERDDPSPEQAIAREVREELNLQATAVHFIGHYRFEQQNQLILAFHVSAQGDIRLSEELAEYRAYAREDLRYWPVATGLALRDWLRSQGHDPQPLAGVA